MTPLLRKLWLIPRQTATGLIALYQATLSPDHGPLRQLYPYGCCRHSPTCSVYGKAIILEKGLLIGGLLAAKRILSCNPFTKPDAQKIMEVSHRR